MSVFVKKKSIMRERENGNFCFVCEADESVFFTPKSKAKHLAMDLSEDNSASNLCYKCEQHLYDNLNIEFNSSNSKVVMWNKYQIFIYESSKFESASRIFIPEYQIQRLLITDNYILSLDTNGSVHVTTLKFKNRAQNILKCSYQPRGQGIKTYVLYNQDNSLSLKYEETYHLCLNKISSDFQEVKKVTLSFKDLWPLQLSSKEKYYLTHRKIEEHYIVLFKKMFKVDEISNNCHFIVLSIDMFTVYGCLFDSKMVEDNTNLLKLYSCPSEICSIDIIGTESTYMLIGLKMGTVIRLALDDLNSCNTTMMVKPTVIHLNTALHKLAVINDTFIYTDGVTMWKADNVFSKDIAFRQFFVKNVHDFMQCGDKMVCTTFTKLTYTFAFHDEKSYHELVKKEFSSAEELLDNTDLLNKIFEEVEKCKELEQKLSIESSYVAAMSLSKRQDIIDNIIQSIVTVYGSLEEVMKINDEELQLTEDICQYLESGVYLLLITVKISCNVQGLSDIISNILENSEGEFHITLSNEHKTLKTTSIKISKTSFLIPVQLQDSTEIVVNIRLVPIIPGAYDKKQKIWTELFTTNIKLTSEHFIRANLQKNLLILKTPMDDFEKAILKSATQFDTRFEFSDINNNPISYTMYVRLPQKFVSGNFGRHFSNSKSDFMVQLLSSKEFLQSKSSISFMVGKEKVEIALINDGFSSPQLKIMSRDLKITWHLRNFFSEIVYGENACKPGEEFINNSFYTTVENLQKAVKDCVKQSASFDEFAPLFEQFEKQVIAMLPV